MRLPVRRETPADGAKVMPMRRTLWLFAWTALLGAPLAGGAAEPVAGRSGEPKAASPDTDLLEFLGSSDTTDADFQDYLQQPVTPPRHVVAAAQPRS